MNDEASDDERRSERRWRNETHTPTATQVADAPFARPEAAANTRQHNGTITTNRPADDRELHNGWSGSPRKAGIR